VRRVAVLLAVALAGAGCGPKPIYRADPVEPAGAISGPAGPAVASARVEEVAAPWLGTPYRYGGTSRRGIDCSALACEILGDLGATLPRTVRDQRMRGAEVPRSRVGPGDLVFFRLGSSRVNHVGVALDRDRFVHASTSRGVVIDRLMDDTFSRNLAGARRVLGSGGEP
jgi:cell wall-associated NlpC family hydrolase